MNTGQPMYKWSEIPWQKLERNIYKLQKRIYKASCCGNVKLVHRLQRLLIKSWSAKCIAVRRVTQDNQGRKTAGVDGIKSLIPKQRLNLVNKLKLGSKVSPTRRVWIPKPGKEEKRPLGIPTMYDRALQGLVKLVLEPEWEARFEPNSYGFRPGRSCQDAIEAIYNSIRIKSKYVLDADISKCFDKINHKRLLEKLNTNSSLSKQIKAWLKSGVMDGLVLRPTSEGTPQGGTISPLLANIALHGMENHIREKVEKMDIRDEHNIKVSRSKRISSVSIIRYADDFVILHKDESVIINCQEIIKDWLSDMGLELKPSKTRLTHSLIKYKNESPGFDFLGFNIKQFKTGKYTTGKDRGDVSPYNGDLIYWSSRMGRHPEMPTRTASLLKKQKGKCKMCELTFRENDVIETDHIIPTAVGGKDEYKNLQLLHGHCHDKKTKSDLEAINKHQKEKRIIEFYRWFNKLNWIWKEDIPYMI